MITRDELKQLKALHDKAIDTCREVVSALKAGGYFKGDGPACPHIFLDKNMGRAELPTYRLSYDDPDDGSPEYMTLRTEWLTGEMPVVEFLDAERERIWKENMLHEEMVVRPKELKELKRLMKKYGQSLRMEQYTLK